MSKRKLPIVGVDKQIALFEVEPVPTSLDCSREGQSIQPPRKPAMEQKETMAVSPAPTSSVLPDGPCAPELTTWLADFMAKTALAEAQRELAMSVPVEPVEDDYSSLE
ncbi:MAG: hypothetical protein ACYC63_11685 [Armatimonadota bacterium]